MKKIAVGDMVEIVHPKDVIIAGTSRVGQQGVVLEIMGDRPSHDAFLHVYLLAQEKTVWYPVEFFKLAYEEGK